MAALNFNCIQLMLADQGSIPHDTLQSQDRLNLGDVHFCPIRRTLCMQCISLEHLWKLIAEGAFMPLLSEGPPELSGTTAILLVFQADGQHEWMTDVYVGLMVCRVDSHLYTPDQILYFVKDMRVISRWCVMLLRLGATRARGVPFASLSATIEAQCPLPWICCTASYTQ